MLAQWSESGGITPQILTNCLKYMDRLDIFPRRDGRVPFVLLDAHASRLSLEFLRYINADAHKWCVCIGVPYGTHLWQVADSEEQNGKFSNEFAKAKKERLKKKWDTGTGKDLNRYDIVPCLNLAFEKSFRNKQTNLKAINDRGWGINLNRVLLNDDQLTSKMFKDDFEREKVEPWGNPSLFDPKPERNIAPSLMSHPVSPSKLNVDKGVAGTYLDNIIQTHDSDKHQHLNISRAFEEKKTYL